MQQGWLPASGQYAGGGMGTWGQPTMVQAPMQMTMQPTYQPQFASFVPAYQPQPVAYAYQPPPDQMAQQTVAQWPMGMVEASPPTTAPKRQWRPSPSSENNVSTSSVKSWQSGDKKAEKKARKPDFIDLDLVEDVESVVSPVKREEASTDSTHPVLEETELSTPAYSPASPTPPTLPSSPTRAASAELCLDNSSTDENPVLRSPPKPKEDAPNIRDLSPIRGVMESTRLSQPGSPSKGDTSQSSGLTCLLCADLALVVSNFVEEDAMTKHAEIHAKHSGKSMEACLESCFPDLGLRRAKLVCSEPELDGFRVCPEPPFSKQPEAPEADWPLHSVVEIDAPPDEEAEVVSLQGHSPPALPSPSALPSPPAPKEDFPVPRPSPNILRRSDSVKTKESPKYTDAEKYKLFLGKAVRSYEDRQLHSCAFPSCTFLLPRTQSLLDLHVRGHIRNGEESGKDLLKALTRSCRGLLERYIQKSARKTKETQKEMQTIACMACQEVVGVVEAEASRVNLKLFRHLVSGHGLHIPSYRYCLQCMQTWTAVVDRFRICRDGESVCEPSFVAALNASVKVALKRCFTDVAASIFNKKNGAYIPLFDKI